MLLFFPAPFSSPFCCIPEASSNRGHTKGALNVHRRDGRVAAPPRLPGANPASARRWGRQQRRQVPGSRRLSRGRAPRVYPRGGGGPLPQGAWPASEPGRHALTHRCPAVPTGCQTAVSKHTVPCSSETGTRHRCSRDASGQGCAVLSAVSSWEFRGWARRFPAVDLGREVTRKRPSLQ